MRNMFTISGYPLVSVVIPCYNYAEFIVEAIDSVVRQTYPYIELTIIDDDSMDDGYLAIRKYDKADFHFIYNHPNIGSAMCRNKALAKARGKYFLPLDADDKIRKDYIELAVKALEENPDKDFAYPNMVKFGDENEEVSLPAWEGLKTVKDCNPMVYCALFKTEALREIGGYKKFPTASGVRGCEDWELWINLAEKGYKGIKLNLPLFYWRRHGATKERRMQPYMNELIEKIKGLHPNVYKEK